MNCPYVMRICNKCGEVKFLFKFSKDKGKKYGFRKECKECKLACSKQYYKEHKKERAEYKKRYNEEHKEEKAEYYKRYRENNKEYYKQYYEDNKEYYKQYNKEHKEERAEYYKQYNKEHKEEIAAQRKKYYKEHKEEIRECQKRYCQTPQGQVTEFNKHNKRRAKEQSQGNGITKVQWLEMMNFFNWKCAYSDIRINKDTRSIDHIVALNNGGLNEIWNCVPMYKNYNSSKNKSDMLEWYQQQDFYSEERLQKIYEWQEYAYNKWNVNI